MSAYKALTPVAHDTGVAGGSIWVVTMVSVGALLALMLVLFAVKRRKEKNGE